MNMVATRVEERATGAATEMVFQWAETLSVSEQEELLSVMNLVLEKEDTIGFPEPLSWVEGMRVINEQTKAMESGAKSVLLWREQETGRIAGQLVLSPSSLPNCKHVAEISRVFVHPAYRGFTVLSRGVKEIVTRCEKLGIDMLTLDVRAHTRIHKLWEGMGFTTMGILPDYARVNGQSFEGAYMYQPVSSLKARLEQMTR